MRMRMLIALLAGCVVGPGVGLAMGESAQQVAPTTTTFTGKAAEQTFVVPADVSSIEVVATGAPGGTGYYPTAVGGAGAQASGRIAVSAGQVLYVEVGEPGKWPGDAAFNGGGKPSDIGGGGGGASDVRTQPRTDAGSLGSRLVVAGGGGGGSWNTAGGAAGAAGASSSPGGGTSCTGGQPGTATQGGAGGTATGSISATTGSAGSLGTGGDAPSTYAGGGGGGLYGGGGGGRGVSEGFTAACGGGGGSSGFAPSVTDTAVVPAASATPSIVLRYTVTSPGGGTTTPPPTTGTTPPPSAQPGPGTTTPAPKALTSLSLPSTQRGESVIATALIGVKGSVLRAALLRKQKVGKRTKNVTIAKLVLGPLQTGPRSFTLKLSTSARRALKAKRKFALTLRVTVSPPEGKATTIERKVTLKPAQ